MKFYVDSHTPTISNSGVKRFSLESIKLANQMFQTLLRKVNKITTKSHFTKYMFVNLPNLVDERNIRKCEYNRTLFVFILIATTCQLKIKRGLTKVKPLNKYQGWANIFIYSENQRHAPRVVFRDLSLNTYI